MAEEFFALRPAVLPDAPRFPDALTFPDAPSAQFRRHAPPPVDTNRLIVPQGSGDEEDGDTSNDSSSAITFDNVTVPELYKALHIRMNSGTSAGSSENPITLQGVKYPERYHWGGLIAQSLFFNGVESAFRIASDDQIRYLVAKKPFWHDYVASMKQFNMRRWNDGDEFLVNYVGHPMQGSVSAYIEIQNSPKDRELQISATRDYWMSRFRGFLWAVVFSTHSEISPLGEAGIGNEGGWTYPIANCHRPCPEWNPKTMHYTNNTGWVDFIITPTVGMLWVFAEDTLDRYVSNRIQGTDQHSIAPKIIRGAINPSRTFANAMRLKKPWYRDFQHDELAERSRPGIHMLRSDDERKKEKLQRFSISGHYRSMPLGTFTNPCALCFSGHGGGFEVDYAVTPWLSATFALDKQQGLSNKNATLDGTAVFTSYGVRLVHDRPHNTFSFAILPGFVQDEVVVPAHVDVLKNTYVEKKSYSMQHTAATLLLSNDYKITRKFAIRSSLGATVVRYPSNIKDPPYVGTIPYLSWLSPKNYSNHTTWVWQGGPVIRF